MTASGSSNIHPEVLTRLGCWCGWQSREEVPDAYRTRLTAEYQTHYMRAHGRPPVIHQRLAGRKGTSAIPRSEASERDDV